jgi:hypothetical protein
MTKKAMPKPKPTTSSVDPETGATRGFETIEIQSINPKTGATRGPDIEMVPVKKAAGGRLGYRSARQPK